MKFDVKFIEGDEKLSSAIFFRALRGFGDESCFMDIRFKNLKDQHKYRRKGAGMTKPINKWKDEKNVYAESGKLKIQMEFYFYRDIW